MDPSTDACRWEWYHQNLTNPILPFIWSSWSYSWVRCSFGWYLISFFVEILGFFDNSFKRFMFGIKLPNSLPKSSITTWFWEREIGCLRHLDKTKVMASITSRIHICRMRRPYRTWREEKWRRKSWKNQIFSRNKEIIKVGQKKN